MKVLNPTRLKFPIIASDEKHFKYICERCRKEGIVWNEKIPLRFNYPVEINLVKPNRFDKFLSFGWEEKLVF